MLSRVTTATHRGPPGKLNSASSSSSSARIAGGYIGVSLRLWGLMRGLPHDVDKPARQLRGFNFAAPGAVPRGADSAVLAPARAGAGQGHTLGLGA